MCCLLSYHFEVVNNLYQWVVQVEKEREGLKGELSKVVAKLKISEAANSEHVNQIEGLNHIISEDHEEMASLKKEVETLKCEKDVLGTQVNPICTQLM